MQDLRDVLIRAVAVAAVFCAAPSHPSAAQQPAARVDYLAQVKPLLRDRCYACHGALKQKAGLRLDTVASMLRGGESGPVVKPGDGAGSLLVARVSENDAAERMPPEHEGEPLTAQHIATLRGWIAAGALAPRDERPEADPREHWAFRPIVRPRVPSVRRADWVKNPIDAFVAHKHEQLGLTPQPEASRLLLLRRLSLDLIGLPPTAEEIAAFQNDTSPDSYERAVERLLNDPRYGERWARHWMDIWRYSDWWGLGDQLRNSQKHIWHWRDWIIESLNADMPYDEMVRLMLAADELHPNDLDKLRATGYLARKYFLFNRNQWMDETVEHVGKGFLGLTMNCAKCHDHKYDPISQLDYYRMRAFFEPYHVRQDLTPGDTDLAKGGIPRAFDALPDAPTYRFIRGQESNPDKAAPVLPGIPAMLEFTPLAIQPVELPVEAWQPERRTWVADAHRTAARQKVAVAGAKLAEARETADLPVAEAAFQAAQAEERSVQRRSAALEAKWKRMDQGADAAPEFVAAEKEAARAAARAQRELAAAQARVKLAEAELRLTRTAADKRDLGEKEVAAARTALEKALQQVEQPSEQFTPLIGAQWTPTRFRNSGSDDPAVPFPPRSTGRRKALAEWITHPRHPLTARVAANHIWNRHFGTPLVPTVFDFGRKNAPPTNPELLDWLAAEFIESGWSMKPLHRLIVQAAVYRQSSSSAGTEANLAVDPDNTHLWRRTPARLESQAVRDSILALAGTLDLARGGPPVPPANQADSTRRSLYFFHSNNERHLFLTMFDEALVKECYRREQSIVPQQALALINSRLVLDAAPRIADRLTRELPLDSQSDDAAFVRLAFAVVLGAEPNEAELGASTHALDAWKKLPEAGSGAAVSAFARGHLIWVLLNHNDFVSLR